MKTTNQWAFSAITGYEPPTVGGLSAETEDWEQMTEDRLREEIEAQVEHYLPSELDASALDAGAVVTAIRDYRETDSQDESYRIYDSLS